MSESPAPAIHHMAVPTIDTQATFKQETGQPTQLFFQLRTRWTIIYDAACRRPLITTATIPAWDSYMRLMRRHQTCRPMHAVKHRWSSPCYFTQKHEFETRGATAPCLSYRIRERMFQGTNVPGSESTRERKYQEAKVPGNESSWERKFQGAKVPCNFRSRERKFHLWYFPAREIQVVQSFCLWQD